MSHSGHGRHSKKGRPFVGIVACLGIGIVIGILALTEKLTDELADTLMMILRLLLASNS